MITGPARRLKKGLGGRDEVPELGFSGVSRKELSKLSASQTSEVAYRDPLCPRLVRALLHGTLHWPPGLLLANWLRTEGHVLTKITKQQVSSWESKWP